MGQNPSQFQHSDQQPVEMVTWFDAVIFCNKFSKREGRKPYYRIEKVKCEGSQVVDAEVTVLGGNGFRLPTEAEWEYACRAGSTTKFPFGLASEADLGNYAWFGVSSGDKTHPVGQRRPNRFGLHDMIGNVWEWCGDWFDRDYYKTSPATDPAGPSSPSALTRVVRGGCSGSPPWYCRPAHRSSLWPEKRNHPLLGFRVAAVQE
jgi:formylglycine-generating enzyme required for sulfatase activity